MTLLIAFLNSLDLTILYQVAYEVAKVVLTFITPVLFVVAIGIRMFENQLAVLVGKGRFADMLKDFFAYGFAISAYAGLGILVLSFFNAVYSWLDGIGSLSSAMKAYGDIMGENAKQVQAAGVTVTGLTSLPYALVAMFFYYGTLIITVFLAAFLKIANAVAYGVAYIWGLIALPISMTQSLNILKGWAHLMGFALVWPIIQGVMMAMFARLFEHSAESLMQITEMDPQLRSANIMLLFAVLNLLLCATLITAPLLANALVANAPSGMTMVAPFAAAAVAAGVGFIKGRDATGGGMGGGSNTTRNIRQSINSLRDGPKGSPSSQRSISGAKQAFESSGGSPAPQAGGTSSTPSVSGGGMSVDANSQRKVKADAAKQRRGVMVTQIRRSKGQLPSKG